MNTTIIQKQKCDFILLKLLLQLRTARHIFECQKSMKVKIQNTQFWGGPEALLPWASVLRGGNIGGDLGNISGGGFGLFEGVQGEVADGADDEEAGNCHGDRAKGETASLVKNTAGVMTGRPLCSLQSSSLHFLRTHFRRLCRFPPIFIPRHLSLCLGCVNAILYKSVETVTPNIWRRGTGILDTFRAHAPSLDT